MIVVIGLVGFLGAIFMFVCAILLWIQGLTWYGIVFMLVGIYYVIQTVFLIKLDGKSTEHENKINKLTEQVKILKEKLGISVEEEDDEEDEVEDFDEDNHDDFFPKGYGTLEKKDNKNNENNDEEG